MNILSKITKKGSIFFLTLATVAIMTGCGQTNGNKQTDAKNDAVPEQTVEQSAEQVVVEPTVESEEEVVVEESTVESEVVEETVEEVDPSTLSDEEWIKSLNLDSGVFLVFNDTTGEKKALEEGQEYQLLEGEKLAFWWPLDWKMGSIQTDLSFDVPMDFEHSYSTIIFADTTFETTEMKFQTSDADGNTYTSTVYVSK